MNKNIIFGKYLKSNSNEINSMLTKSMLEVAEVK